MECTAKNVTGTSTGTAAKPDGWDCQVEKRCVCVSCTKQPKTELSYTGEPSGKDYYTGEPCSCDAIPDSVAAHASLKCAQT